MFAYGAASQFWRAVPLGLAERAWQRRGRVLLERAARSVPAYGRLLRILAGQGASEDGFPSLVTGRCSYIDVYPLELRCRKGGGGPPIAFDPCPVDAAEGTPAVSPPCESSGQISIGWPRGRDELRILRRQLVGLLSGWFGASRRRTLMVLALPETGWCGRGRIGRAIQEALALGQLRGAVLTIEQQGHRVPATFERLAGGFDQCIVLADPAGAVLSILDLVNVCGHRGLVCLGPVPAAIAEGVPRDIQVCSVLGMDEAGPLIGAETPFSRIVLQACQTRPPLGAGLFANDSRLLALYQPLPCGPWLESIGKDLFISSWGTAPLLRYRTGWHGRVIPFARTCRCLGQEQVLSSRALRKLSRVGSTCWKLPLIAVFEA